MAPLQVYVMSLPVIKQELHQPSLQETAETLRKGLAKNFSEVSVEVVHCPNLSEPPWGLAAPGICGSPRIGEVGGVRLLFPVPHLNKTYNFQELAKDVDLPDALIIGASAGPYPYVGTNSEMIPNIRTGKLYKNESRIVKLHGKNFEKILEKLPAEESRCSLLFNFYACEGKLGSVLKVRAKTRTGEDDFVGCMRKALANQYDTKPVGIGGTFMMKTGTAKLHVMPDFSKVPLNSDEEVNNWLKYFHVKGPIVFMSVFISHDPGLEVRLEHSHGYTDTDGGHYHYDTTPDEVEYEGYFNVADYIYRVDRPMPD